MRYNFFMPLLYRGREFRKRHGVTQIELARGAGMRPGTLVELEKGRAHPTTETLERIIAFFHARDVPCGVGDLLVYEAEELNGRQDSGE